MNFTIPAKKYTLAIAAIASQIGAFTFAACSSDDSTTPVPNDASADTSTRRDTGTPESDAGKDADGNVDAGGNERTVYAVDDQDQLLKFSTGAPGVVSKVPISGASSVLGIDFRPFTGDLYALGTNGTVYIVNKETGSAAAAAGDAGVLTYPFVLDPAATSFGFDFNPAADRIRVHANTGQNLRLHPANGQAVNTTGDGKLSYEDGGTVKIVGSAYTNSVNPKPTTTALFGIDSDSNQLVTFFNVDGGTAGGFAGARNVGALGVDAQELGGFDIYGGQGGGDGGPSVDKPIEAYAALRSGNASLLYRVNLQTGAASSLGAIAHDRPLRGIAVQP